MPATLSTAPVDELVELWGDDRARPDVEWVSALAAAPPSAVRATLAELLAFRRLLGEMRQVLRGGGRESYAQICAPFELYAIARLTRPRQIVETGVSSGVSSTHFLLALRQNRRGHLHSIDRPTFQRAYRLGPAESPVSLPPGRRTGWAVPPSLRAGWDLRIGPSQLLLGPLLRELPGVELFLHDDLHTEAHLRWELSLLAPRLRPGSVVLADNTRWTGGAMSDFGSRYGVRPIAKRGSDLVGFRVPARPADHGPR